MSNDPKYKVGDVGPAGVKIAHIHGESNSILVYEDSDGRILYFVDADELSNAQAEAVRYFDNLTQQVFDILPKSYWKRWQQVIGPALFQSLQARDVEKSRAAYEEPQRLVVDKCTTYRRVHYWLSALIASVSLGVVLLAFYWWYPIVSQRFYALCTVFGIAGALTSVMQRAGAVEVGDREDRAGLWIRGTSRVVVGGLFAAFFVVASKANLVLGIATSGPWVFLAFSFLSGISERFVPELISQVEKNKTTGSHGKVAGHT